MMMRHLAIAAIVGLTLAGAGPALAQGVLDGPLAAPGAVPPKAPVSSISIRQRKKAPRHAAKQAPTAPALAHEIPDREATPATHRPARTADEALSLGMKWNGSNDNGSQTRVQNYNGTAVGTGAEVGLKLHF